MSDYLCVVMGVLLIFILHSHLAFHFPKEKDPKERATCL